MKNLQNNFTVTTIYFDGQFWCALIEQCRNGENFAGRHVFGAEPSNPQLLNWMIYDFAKTPLLPVEGKSRIRFKKLMKTEGKAKGGGGAGSTGKACGFGVPKSLKAFSLAQKEYAQERKAQSRKQKKLEEKEKYLLKHIKKKERR